MNQAAHDPPVDIVPYVPNWPAHFQEERENIAQALGPDSADIQHVGSTAIPGLAASPAIDICMAVEPLEEAEEYTDRLASIGYRHRPDLGRQDCHVYDKEDPRDYRLFVVMFGGWTYWRLVFFRDYLRTHRAVAMEYETLKRELALKHRHDRAAYQAGKLPFVERIVSEALKHPPQPPPNPRVP